MKHISFAAVANIIDSTLQCSDLVPSYRWHSEGSTPDTCNWRGTEMSRTSASFCVSQSIKILPFAQDNLAQRLMELGRAGEQGGSLESTVSLRSFGSSSLNWDSVIRFEGQPLAVAQRTFVRTCGVSHKPLEFTPGEKVALDDLIDPLDVPALDGLRARVSSMSRIPDPPHSSSKAKRAALLVTGQHTNFGNHVDHAQLLELSLLGCPATSSRPTFAKIDYMFPGNVGDEVEIVSSISESEGKSVVDVQRNDNVLCRTVFEDFEEFSYSLLTDDEPLVSQSDCDGGNACSKRCLLKLKQHRIEDFKTLKHEATNTSEESASIRRSMGWADASAKLGLKAMLLNLGKGKGFCLAVLEGDKRIDMKKVRKSLNNSKVKIASSDRVKEVTACEVGGVPPFGSLFDVKTLVDSAVLKNETCFFNAGDKTLSVQMKVKDWLKIEQPEVQDFTATS
ncbi:hypothetical protein TrST_g8422 [Triparma strigata]|uniref:YbaK/aminoacyl-tRNA synthetase-associated domain-containing protein n=1 Tax=Triparma strigata TaxID=1606541 RepID=A0A9W7AD43_9STRA|nr:hypothetical protein TrST_g8422 [Triparma strigata]